MVTLIFHVIVSLTALWKICGLINRCYVTSVNYCGGTLGGWGGGGRGMVAIDQETKRQVRIAVYYSLR